MADGRRRRLPSWLFALVAVGLGLLLAEAATRAAFLLWFRYFDESGHCALAKRDEPYARLAFTYHATSDSGIVPDAAVGYRRDTPPFRGVGNPPDPTRSLRVVTLGDSFTVGVGVAPAESWPGWLATALAGAEVLNLAAEAYGLDQAQLRFETTPEAGGADFVVLGYYELMRRRAGLDWHCAAKPRFVRTGASLEITGQPVPGPDRIVAEGLTIPALVWAVRLLDSAIRPPPEATRDDEDALFFAILARFASSVRKAGARPIVVFLPGSADVSSSPSPNQAHVAALKRWCSEHQVAFVDPSDPVFGPRTGPDFPKRVAEGFPPNTGHYSSAVNRGVAEVVASKIRESLPPSGIEKPPEAGKP
jgi:hypothetical protein